MLSIFSFIRYHESGIRMRMDSIVNYVPSVVKDKEHFKPVEIEQMIHVIAIPLMGLFLSIIIIIIEKAQTYRANKKSLFTQKNEYASFATQAMFLSDNTRVCLSQNIMAPGLGIMLCDKAHKALF